MGNVSTVVLARSLLVASFGFESSARSTAKILLAQTPLTIKFDEYGFISFAKEKPRLDRLAGELRRRRQATCHIIVYGTYDGEGEAHANRIKRYLAKKHGIDPARMIIEGQYCRAGLKTELWVVPLGAVTPAPIDRELTPCKAKRVRTPTNKE